ncbi:hypothetical protein [Clostridium butyricum]|nr:hypothetical protein [Clostridium butyricum]BBK76189.1 hypothetical protein Cbu04g_11970 [Clostridium butyricum]GEQ25667.1 hypothetical protein CBU03nite_20900 [Clostridium butyricum]
MNSLFLSASIKLVLMQPHLKEENIQLVKDNCNDNEETIKVILME